MNWDWKKLLAAVLAAVVGWLTNTVFPAPGTMKTPPAAAVEKRIPG